MHKASSVLVENVTSSSWKNIFRLYPCNFLGDPLYLLFSFWYLYSWLSSPICLPLFRTFLRCVLQYNQNQQFCKSFICSIGRKPFFTTNKIRCNISSLRRVFIFRLHKLLSKNFLWSSQSNEHSRTCYFSGPRYFSWTRVISLDRFISQDRITSLDCFISLDRVISIDGVIYLDRVVL